MSLAKLKFASWSCNKWITHAKQFSTEIFGFHFSLCLPIHFVLLPQPDREMVLIFCFVLVRTLVWSECCVFAHDAFTVNVTSCLLLLSLAPSSHCQKQFYEQVVGKFVFYQFHFIFQLFCDRVCISKILSSGPLLN